MSDTPQPLLSAETGRADLADALEAAGPEAPTLCEGWRAADLATHLWVREARPDLPLGRLAGRVIAPLKSRSSRVHRDLLTAARTTAGFTALVERFRAGPPAISLAAIPRVGRAADLMEFFIHLLDVSKAGETDTTPPLSGSYSEAIWSQLTGLGALLYFRSSPVGVILRRPDGVRKAVKRGAGGSVIVTGTVTELTLMASGRPADVTVDGDESDVRAFRTTKPRLGS
ncbi:TIGR03085 family metal-binding protein [Spelaeicoccus albus]|uniref:Uncharacterized protein (TIGR03085 family) n=1 Tax=Spelaeicoccus albus TaxID=1280376 RepID=A0A7Z0IIP7_9MICO|nr:TIGR03085 family metal-binding protein [Spelaeicoccus albus]NYI68587.1 uncharacterized protein (TIGR03085 family) [Spelaeicoccus albus]